MTLLDKLLQKKDPQKAKELKDKAIALLRNDNAKDALELFSESIMLNDNDDVVYFYIGLCNYYLDHFEKSLFNFNIAIQNSSKEKSPYYYYRGMTFEKMSKDNEALQDFDKAIELDPEDSLPYRERANIYFSFEKYHEAVKNWDKFILLEPDNFNAYSYRGYCKAFLGGDLTSAIDDINKAISADSSKSSYFFHRGFTYMMMGSFVSARTDMTKASELGDEDALNVLNDFEDRIAKNNEKKQNDKMVNDLKKSMPNW